MAPAARSLDMTSKLSRIRAAICVVVSGSAKRTRTKGKAWTGGARRAGAEVGVVGDDDSVVEQCSGENLVVRGVLQPEVANGDGVVAGGSEQLGRVW
jgi:hypothetical protein